MPTWTVNTTEHAAKALARVPRPEQKRLRAVLGEMGENPTAGNIKRLHNERSAFRRRVGDWRIFFDLHHTSHVVTVVAIERRTTITYRRR